MLDRYTDDSDEGFDPVKVKGKPGRPRKRPLEPQKLSDAKIRNEDGGDLVSNAMEEGVIAAGSLHQNELSSVSEMGGQMVIKNDGTSLANDELNALLLAAAMAEGAAERKVSRPLKSSN